MYNNWSVKGILQDWSIDEHCDFHDEPGMPWSYPQITYAFTITLVNGTIRECTHVLTGWNAGTWTWRVLWTLGAAVRATVWECSCCVWRHPQNSQHFTVVLLNDQTVLQKIKTKTLCSVDVPRKSRTHSLIITSHSSLMSAIIRVTAVLLQNISPFDYMLQSWVIQPPRCESWAQYSNTWSTSIREQIRTTASLSPLYILYMSLQAARRLTRHLTTQTSAHECQIDTSLSAA